MARRQLDATGTMEAMDRFEGQAFDVILRGAAEANAPGCAAGAMRGGKIVFSGAYGLTDLKHKTPLTGATASWMT